MNTYTYIFHTDQIYIVLVTSQKIYLTPLCFMCHINGSQMTHMIPIDNICKMTYYMSMSHMLRCTRYMYMVHILHYMCYMFMLHISLYIYNICTTLFCSLHLVLLEFIRHWLLAMVCYDCLLYVLFCIKVNIYINLHHRADVNIMKLLSIHQDIHN